MVSEYLQAWLSIWRILIVFLLLTILNGLIFGFVILLLYLREGLIICFVLTLFILRSFSVEWVSNRISVCLVPEEWLILLHLLFVRWYFGPLHFSLLTYIARFLQLLLFCCVLFSSFYLIVRDIDDDSRNVTVKLLLNNLRYLILSNISVFSKYFSVDVRIG